MKKKQGLTHLQKLDSVLTFLNHDNDEPSSIPELVEGIDFETTSKEMYLILNKLAYDRNAAQVDWPIFENTKTTEVRSHITLEGRIFNEGGGYVKEKANKDTLIKDTKDRNGRMERNEVRLVRWTRILAFGAIGLVVWEMIKTLYLER
jgi:hypothetical protein